MSVYDELTETQQFASRVIADHARSTAFAIADGILPGNEGRNYVLRKIIRRAIYHGREHLALNELFFYKVCDEVVTRFQGAFPELATQRDFIGKMVRIEEERFGSTITTGLREFEDHKGEVINVSILKEDQEFFGWNFDKNWDDESGGFLLVKAGEPSQSNEVRYIASKDTGKIIKARITNSDKSVFEVERKSFPALAEQRAREAEERYSMVSGAAVNLNEVIRGLVPLYDTYGTPRDIIRVKLEELELSLDEDTFNEIFDHELSELQKRSGIGKTERKSVVSLVYAKLLEKVGANQFHGYETTHFTGAKVVGILDGETPVDSIGEGQQGSVVLDQTPFYAESGGQVGDTGSLIGVQPPATAGGSDMRATVSDTYSPVSGLIIHKVTVENGSITVGDAVTATVDAEKRDATRRNHTATHLVHAALREVLGTHVKQAGSVVGPSVLRFDFTHYQPMSASEIAEVEDLVNRHILENNPVNTNVMSIEEAMSGGAMALFGEKYGSDVRVLSVGDGVFSKELCGGTHVRATGDIGSFKITGDEAIASGVRRIRAITGLDAFNRFREDEKLIDASLGALNTQRDNLPNAIARLQEELKKTRKEMDELKLKIATGSIGDASSGGDEPREINGVKVLGKVVEGLDGGGTRQLSDTLLARLKSGVVIIGRSDEGKVGIIVRVSDDLTSKVKAGDIIREIAPIVGGRGGGKPDMAEGGGTDPAKLGDAIEASYRVIEKILTIN